MHKRTLTRLRTLPAPTSRSSWQGFSVLVPPCRKRLHCRPQSTCLLGDLIVNARRHLREEVRSGIGRPSSRRKRSGPSNLRSPNRRRPHSWLPLVRRNGGSYLFPSRRKISQHLSTRQYARIVHRWVASIGLEASAYVTHSMRRTKAAQIYKKTGNLRAVQILLGHTKLESTVRYLGLEVDDALRIAEQIEL